MDFIASFASKTNFNMQQRGGLRPPRRQRRRRHRLSRHRHRLAANGACSFPSRPRPCCPTRPGSGSCATGAIPESAAVGATGGRVRWPPGGPWPRALRHALQHEGNQRVRRRGGVTGAPATCAARTDLSLVHPIGQPLAHDGAPQPLLRLVLRARQTHGSPAHACVLPQPRRGCEPRGRKLGLLMGGFSATKKIFYGCFR